MNFPPLGGDQSERNIEMDDRFRIEHEDLKKAVQKEKERAKFWALTRKNEFFSEFTAKMAAERNHAQMNLRHVKDWKEYQGVIAKIEERENLLAALDREGGDSRLSEATRRLNEFEEHNALMLQEKDAEESAGGKVKSAKGKETPAQAIA